MANDTHIRGNTIHPPPYHNSSGSITILDIKHACYHHYDLEMYAIPWEHSKSFLKEIIQHIVCMVQTF